MAQNQSSVLPPQAPLHELIRALAAQIAATDLSQESPVSVSLLLNSASTLEKSARKLKAVCTDEIIKRHAKLA